MDCKEVQKRIPDYVINRINGKEQEAFIAHVRSCKACYEELETLYTIQMAVAILDEGKDSSFNFSGKLEKDLQEKEWMLRRQKRVRILFVILLAVFLCVMAAAVLMHFGYQFGF